MNAVRTVHRIGARHARPLVLAAALLAGIASAASGSEAAPPLTPAAQAGQSGSMLILKPDEPQPLGDGRTIVLTDLVEKRLVPDRRSMMRARFTIAGGGQDDSQLELTSDEPRAEVRGAVIEYLGGWRSEAQLRVTLVPPGAASTGGQGN